MNKSYLESILPLDKLPEEKRVSMNPEAEKRAFENIRNFLLDEEEAKSRMLTTAITLSGRAAIVSRVKEFWQQGEDKISKEYNKAAAYVKSMGSRELFKWFGYCNSEAVLRNVSDIHLIADVLYIRQGNLFDFGTVVELAKQLYMIVRYNTSNDMVEVVNLSQKQTSVLEVGVILEKCKPVGKMMLIEGGDYGAKE